MPVSEAQARATAKYRAKAYDMINLKVPKGERDVINDHAAAQGESTNAFIRRAIGETMARDNKAPEE